MRLARRIRVERRDEHPGEVLADVRVEHPQRAEHPREPRHQHPPRPESAPHRRPVHRPRAAAGHEHEAGRVAPALGADPFRRLQQVLLDEADHPDRRLLHAEPERVAHPRAQRGPRAFEVERDRAARIRPRRQPSEHELRIGHRRLLAAAAVGGGSGNRARPARPGEQQPRRVRAGDGAAAGPDGVDVHRRRHEVVAADLQPVGDRDPPARAQHHVAGRAADLHRDQIVDPGGGSEVVEGAHPARRPGQHQVHRTHRHLANRDRPPVRLQHQQLRPEAQRAQPLVEGVQVAHHLRADAGVDHGGGAALVLADDRHHLMGERHPLEACPRILESGACPRMTGSGTAPPAQHLGAAALVGAVLEAVQQADRDRLHPLGAERLDRGVEIGLVQRLDLHAPRIHAPADRQAQVARHQHRRIRGAVVEGVRPEAAPRFEEVPEAAGDEHPDPRPAALQHGVGGDGGAVQEQRAVREQMLDARRERARGVLHHVEHAAAGIGGHRRHLEDVEAPGAVHQHHVGEGTADVDGDAVSGS